MRLYDSPISGNSYKVRLLLLHLDRPYDYVPVDILKGETRTPEFLRKNPTGQIPVLELDDGTCLAQSNAILFHLAQGTKYFPRDLVDQTRVLQWLFFEQNSHEPSVANARFAIAIKKVERTGFNAELISMFHRQGNAALSVMDQYLQANDFFGRDFCIADIALYAYTHQAGEGEFDLSRFPAVVAWLRRVEAQPRHMTLRQWNDEYARRGGDWPRSS